ncbi:carboxylating nicotinate-nucleotide diphosphorylase, partial [bacterium]|nr:carboxylating nicotinate-nucleotide diphosphorylase [bacterium]
MKIIMQKIVQQALQEDLSFMGDLTSNSLLDFDQEMTFCFQSRQAGILAGLKIAQEVFYQINDQIQFEALCQDGNVLKSGQVFAKVKGSALSILSAERLALNFLQRLSGIATLTHQMVQKVPKEVRVCDTRKTTPNLRVVEKYAVRMGGGYNHRFNLSDCVLLKDNHLALCKKAGLSIQAAIQHIRNQIPHSMKIEMEADSIDQVKEALIAKVDLI